MAAITKTTGNTAIARPTAKAQQAPVPTREQKLEMARDRFESTRYKAEERVKSEIGAGVKGVQVGQEVGHKVGRALGSVVGAGGKDDAPAVLGEVAGTLVSAPVSFAVPIAMSMVNEGIMFVAEQRIKHVDKQLGR